MPNYVIQRFLINAIEGDAHRVGQALLIFGQVQVDLDFGVFGLKNLDVGADGPFESEGRQGRRAEVATDGTYLVDQLVQ